MHKYLSELNRLYLPAGSVSPEALQQHLKGETSLAVHLASRDGMTRAMVIAFPKTQDSADGHWTRLCAVANALQGQLGLPAPAVSISGDNAFGLWLSLAQPTPVAQVQQFMTLLMRAYHPEAMVDPNAVSLPVPLLPCLHQGIGKWGAYIHPGLGASFIDDMGLEMAPPLAAQTAFLEGLESIQPSQFQAALAKLQLLQPQQAVEQHGSTTPADGLLLKDASLEDIIAHLHALNIEPTFRHLKS